MKRLTIAVAILALLAACSYSPTGNDGETAKEPIGTLRLKVGPDAEVILSAESASQVPDLVAAAWREQQNYDVYKEAADAATLIMDLSPEVVEIIQSRLSPAENSKPIPVTVEYPEFAPILQEYLASMGLEFRIYESDETTNCFVPMAVGGHSDVNMKLTVTTVVLSHATWQP